MHPQSTAAATAAEPPHSKRRLGRSRTTNNPSFLPRKPLSPFQAARRQRDLVEAFVKALGGSVTELVAVQVRKCAELLTLAEGIRAGALGGTPQTSGDLTALIRIEGEARRCLKALGIKIEPAPKLSGGLTIARARWEEQRAQEKAKKAATEAAGEASATHTPEPSDGRAA
jgi:hypothetical protein